MSNLKYPLLVLEICGNICLYVPSQSTLRLLRPLSCSGWSNGGGDLTLSKWSRYFCPKKVVFWPRVINRFCMSTLLFVWRGGCWITVTAFKIIEFIGGTYDRLCQNLTYSVCMYTFECIFEIIKLKMLSSILFSRLIIQIKCFLLKDFYIQNLFSK